MNPDQLDCDFLKAYHKVPLIEMAKALREFLNSAAFFDFTENRHWLYLRNEMDRHIANDKRGGSGRPQELPGMVYGMYCNAWGKLKEDMKNV